MKAQMILIVISLGFNLFDLITGIVKAFKDEKKLNSTKLRDGLFKKSGFMLLYCFAVMLNIARVKFNFPFPVDIVPIICGYVVFTEIISIIENLSEINVEIVPDILKKLIGLDKIQGEENGLDK